MKKFIIVNYSNFIPVRHSDISHGIYNFKSINVDKSEQSLELLMIIIVSHAGF